MAKNFFFLFATFLAQITQAYPDFVGMGYTTCVTCHYNGAGGGPLNDYGRNLFAVEIAAKPFYSPTASDDHLGETSGFFAGKDPAWWLRPGLKYRGLNLQNNIGSKNPNIRSDKFYNMQADGSITLLFDKQETLILVMQYGFAENKDWIAPNVHTGSDYALSREHYVRYKWNDNWWIYGGFMDKTYGIRHPDHTAVNRKMINLGQNDQVYGAVIHYITEKNEVFLNPYLGNTRQVADSRNPGMAGLFEFDIAEKRRLGFSVLSEKLKGVSRSRGALIGKFGMGEGHALLIESGLSRDVIDGNTTNPTAAYTFTQASLKLARGTSLVSAIQYFKSDVDTAASENFSWGLGILYFPMQRVELRAQLVQQRLIDKSQVGDDSWALQTQLHLSL